MVTARLAVIGKILSFEQGAGLTMSENEETSRFWQDKTRSMKFEIVKIGTFQFVMK